MTRAGVVYELFFTNLPQHAFTACDVVELYLHRPACIQLLRHQQVMVQVEAQQTTLAIRSTPLSRAERAHARLSWEKRLARNAHPPGKGQVTIKLCGVPDQFAGFLG